MDGSSSFIIDNATLEDLGTLLDHVDQLCAGKGLPGPALFAIKLAVEEVCANIINHGYGQEGTGRIEVSVEIGDGEVVLGIRDQASPFEPDSVPHPDLDARLKDRKIGGLGWHLVREVMDEVRHESPPDGGNRYTMVKRFPAAAGEPGEDG